MPAGEVIITALVSGAIVGTLLGAFGGGGSVLATPLLVYLVGVDDAHTAIGTSAAAVAAIALFGLFGHWRGRRVKWPCAIAFALAGLVGSVVGSSLAKQIPGDVLLLAFAFVMAAIGGSMMLPRRAAGTEDVALTPAMMVKIAPLGVATGTAAGFFGIGGGFLIVPGLMLASGMTMANATASSLVSVALFGAATSANYAMSGYIDLNILMFLLVGGAVGGVAGVQIARQLSGRAHLARTIFAGMIILVAIYVAVRAAGDLGWL
ncbi:TSUP family transporter [bacterium]|nr:TSUP family transporter [bacterium]